MFKRLKTLNPESLAPLKPCTPKLEAPKDELASKVLDVSRPVVSAQNAIIQPRPLNFNPWWGSTETKQQLVGVTEP